MNTPVAGQAVLSLNGIRVRFLTAMSVFTDGQRTPSNGDAGRGGRSVIGGLLRIGLGMLAFALLARGAFAQEDAQGSVEGYVYEDGTGDPLPGATVVIGGTTQGAVTDQDGFYLIEGVASGMHLLVASFLGYAQEEVEITVSPGEKTRQNLTLGAAALELEDVVVTGLRRGQVLSVNEKRQALSVVDVITGDEAGKLPDLNVAETAQRIPGITIRTDRGEGRFVSIRGTPPNRNNVTFNGQAMASSAGTRSTALDLVPSEMVASIEVQKALTPDMPANALGGSVNIETLTAFDRDRSFLTASFSGMQHQLTTNYGDPSLPFRASLTTGTRLGANDAWGIVLSGTASRRTFNTAIASPTNWVEVDGTAAPAAFNRTVEDNNRNRYSVNANLDYRPTPRTSAYARLHYSQLDEDFTNTEVIFTGGDELPTSATVGRIEDFESQLDIPTTDLGEQLYAFTLGGEQQFGNNLTWEAEGTYSRGKRDRLDFQPEWGVDQNFALNYDVGGEFEELNFDDMAAVSNPENYLFTEMDIQEEDLRENTYQIGTDLRWDLRFGDNIGFLKTGGLFLLRDKDIDRDEDPWAAGDLPLTLSQFAAETPDPLQGGARVPVTGDVFSFLDFWEENNDPGDPNYFFLDPIESAQEEVEVDAYVTEDVYAGYLMGNVRMGALTATGGLRVEATTTTSERYRFVTDDVEFEEAEITLQEAENSYVDFMPSVHLVYQLTDQMQVRGAFSNTIGRPDYDELSGFQSFEFELVEPDSNIWEASIEEGNPDLKPLRAMNFDLTVEFYPGPGDLLSVGAFYKRISDPIFGFDFEQQDVFGRDFDVEIQDIPGFDERFFREVSFAQLRNANSGVIRGLEISFLYLFDFLPGPLRGFGLASNASIMSSDLSVPDREDEDLPFFDQSDLVYNVAPYYQLGPLELRVALNYQSAYLNGIAQGAFQDRYGDERLTIDLSSRYEFMDGRLQLNAYVRNLTNEAERVYQAVSSRRRNHELTGRSFELGVAVQL